VTEEEPKGRGKTGAGEAAAAAELDTLDAGIYGDSGDAPAAADANVGESDLEGAATAAAEAMARSDAPRLKKGDSVGRLTVLESLGEGAFGIVLAAYDPELDRKVALKVLRTLGFGSAYAERARVRLLREARAMARLSHPNVVTVHDVGTVQNHVYLAMEYVAGGTLAEWLAEQTRSWREILDVFRDAGRGLAAAHEAGFAHRDFKPANVLIDARGRARVADFGLVSAGAETLEGDLLEDSGPSDSSLYSTLTRTGDIIGTPIYMAPEQHRGEEADASADQFAFCVALYQALYGRRPFAGDNYKDLVRTVLDGNVAEPPGDADVPEWIRAIVERGLSAAKGDRYPSMEALLADLERDPVAARRKRFTIAGVAAVIVALAAGLVFALMRSGGDAEDPCADTAERLVRVWDDDVKKKVREAFVATGRWHAVDTYGRVEKVLDEYAGAWVERQTEACEATRKRGEAADQLAYLRMVCLSQRLDELGDLVDRSLVTASIRMLDDAQLGARSTHDAPIAGRVLGDHREHSGAGAGASVLGDQSPQRRHPQEGHVAAKIVWIPRWIRSLSNRPAKI